MKKLSWVLGMTLVLSSFAAQAQGDFCVNSDQCQQNKIEAMTGVSDTKLTDTAMVASLYSYVLRLDDYARDLVPNNGVESFLRASQAMEAKADEAFKSSDLGNHARVLELYEEGQLMIQEYDAIAANLRLVE